MKLGDVLIHVSLNCSCTFQPITHALAALSLHNSLHNTKRKVIIVILTHLWDWGENKRSQKNCLSLLNFYRKYWISLKTWWILHLSDFLEFGFFWLSDFFCDFYLGLPIWGPPKMMCPPTEHQRAWLIDFFRKSSNDIICSKYSRKLGKENSFHKTVCSVSKDSVPTQVNCSRQK